MSPRVLAPVAAAALLLTGCASGSQAGATPKPSHSASPSASSTPMLVPDAPASTPLGAGQRVWAAFSQRGLSHAEWWARLKPLLSQAAQAAYVYDDPRNLPEMTLTGKLTVAAKAPDEPRFTSEVLVPTSKGTFALDLNRARIGGPWRLYAIKFPSGVH